MHFNNVKSIYFTNPTFKVCSRQEAHEYDISFVTDYRCQKNPKIPFLGNTRVCASCYTKELINKMFEVRKSKRKDFIDYQFSIQEDKLLWLNELKDILTDYESQFDYEFYSNFIDLIDAKLFELKGGSLIQNEPIDIVLKSILSPTNKTEQVINLPDNFKLPELGIKSKVVSRDQAAILFFLLKKHQAIINYSDNSLSKLISVLTGHSEQNIRENLSLKKLEEIMANNNFSNLESLSELLQKIIEDIEKYKEKLS